MTLNETQEISCTYCCARAPRLYSLPDRATRDLHVAGPACFFCFVRRAGIRPTRRRLVWQVDGGERRR